ncbi:MAG: porin [Campylobacterales bacterium]|nr:porin [Campylobacterales bacterium]
MKLAKLSLAAIVAVGAMTTFASAAPLEEAIKGVEISGMVRYRFESLSNGDKYKDNSRERHRFSVPVSFTIPVADGLKAGVSVRAEQNEGRRGYNATGGIVTDPDGNDKIAMTKAWFMYTQPTFSLKAGKFEIATPWTDPGYAGDRGTGALALFTGVEGWTFAAAAFAQTNIGAESDTYRVTANSGDIIEFKLANDDGMAKENLYAAAAIGSVGPVDLQVWATRMSNVIDNSFFLQASTKFEGFSIKAQANRLKLDSDVKATDRSGTFYGAEAGFATAGFKVGAGYTKNDKKQPIYELSADSSAMIKAGKQIYYQTSNKLDAKTMFFTAGYSFDKYRVGAGYVRSKANDGTVALTSKETAKETYLEAGYKYSKNFDLYAYYSMMDNKKWAGHTSGVQNPDFAKKSNQIRFQALYSF